MKAFLPIRKSSFLIFFIAFRFLAPSTAQGLSSAQVDSIVAESMKRMPQAGVAIAVVKDGKVIHSGGYGLCSINGREKVDGNTLFAIASNSKAFTAAALAMLVDEGKLDWNDKVVEYIPEFRMYDPYITENFTVEDLLTHRSGLGLGAGDLMIFPDGSDFTIGDVARSFQYQEQVSQFRTKFDYDNLLYIIAGEVVHRVSGQSWEDFIEENIMAPLGMNRSAASFSRLKNTSNVAAPHSSENGKLEQVDRYSHELTNAAGGIYASVNDMSRWMLMQLNGGKYGEGLSRQLFSEARQGEMWYPHTMLNFDVDPHSRYERHFSAYGLGWQLADYKGNVVMTHTGGLPGMLSMVALVPALDLGVVVLTNTQPGGYGYFANTYAILDSYLDVEQRDWIEQSENMINATAGEVDSVVTAVWETVGKSKSPAALDNFTGMYNDDWFGQVEIYEQNKHLWFRSIRSPRLSGPMYYYRANTFAVKMDYTAMNCDAFVIFTLDEEGRAVSFRMKGISPNIDFSFDYQDLLLEKEED